MRLRRPPPAVGSDPTECGSAPIAGKGSRDQTFAGQERGVTLVRKGKGRSVVGCGFGAHPGRGLAAAVDLELLQDAVDVVLDGRGADLEPAADVLV